MTDAEPTDVKRCLPIAQRLYASSPACWPVAVTTELEARARAPLRGGPEVSRTRIRARDSLPGRKTHAKRARALPKKDRRGLPKRRPSLCPVRAAITSQPSGAPARARGLRPEAWPASFRDPKKLDAAIACSATWRGEVQVYEQEQEQAGWMA